MANRPHYKCKKCGKVHKHFDDWLFCCPPDMNYKAGNEI